MAQDEELTAEREHSAESDIAAELKEALADEPDVEGAATSFLEIEEELDQPIEGLQARGRAVDVGRVPSSAVPADYPAEIGTEDALALYLELSGTDGGTVVTYFEWPDDGAGGRLAKLLDLRDVPGDRFADLHGESILLEVQNGHYVPVLPKEEPKGDARGVFGVFAGLAILLLPGITAMFGLGEQFITTGFIILWLLANFVLLPIATYVDAWNLRTTTDWDGGPLFWASVAAVPVVNVISTVFYLISRGNSDPII